ncbi:N-acetyltransferase [Oceanidesulfovibrio indonesiensis]|uniref:N-acetyltransferase n=1 Tax=Oceanidesulfovibrio indonesiensis TaxID=54767 RepID=A0A7M3MEV7_9BACT|nr:N-acetyltransferase [Oceanidesulfovibrio indonesiensis]TVM17414.1 N-acetyltransferase [Oceanidesulfovibrio indonesiensis]
MPDDFIRKTQFRDIDLDDPFFDSLKEAYAAEFASWFAKKATQGEEAYVGYSEDNRVHAFLYVKEEQGTVNDITPHLNTTRCLKIGTFKIDAHGTKLGERFIKKIFDETLERGLRHAYVTIFPKHEPLIKLLKRYGFDKYGIKETINGIEHVYLKDLSKIRNDLLLDYPVINAQNNKKWLLGIWPQFHTRLFPDSILKTENSNIIDDLSYTNSIHKVYIAFMVGLDQINTRDCLVIYRTADQGMRPWFKSVATALCVVQETRSKNSFLTEKEFIEYSSRHSIFTRRELSELFHRKTKHPMYAIQMTYNIALPKRPNMKQLVEDVGLERNQYWGFSEIPHDNFTQLLQVSHVHEGTVLY